MTPSMYVVCSAHICQGLRGWAGAGGRDGGHCKHKEDAQGLRERVCVCFCKTPAGAGKLNTLYLLWEN